MPNSIRLRLPASYGAIAFLTIVSLLQGPDLDSFPPQDLVKSQVNSLAF